MPGNKCGITGKLDEPIGAPHQQIGTDRTFDRIQNPGMRDDLINPGQRQMGECVDGPPLAGNQLAQAIFVLSGVVVELPAKFRCLGFAENLKGIEITILFVKLPLLLAETSWVLLTPGKGG